MEAPGSGAAEPIEDDRIEEPAQRRSNAATSPSSNGAPSALPPRPPTRRPHHEQTGGGADGSSSAAAGVDRKGKGIAAGPFPPPFPPSSAGSIPDFAFAFGAGGSSSSAGRRMMVPRDATLPFDYRQVFQQVLREQQSVIIEEGEEEQVKSPHAKDALPRKEKV